jgi:3-hydroxyisobutyrate dehydrogenase-like beta-hydroxyacid dehydrogenase
MMNHSAENNESGGQRPLAGVRIGFIGLGLMGRPMACNLLKAGASLVVHNRSHQIMAEFQARGAAAAETPRAVAETIGTGVIILMLTNTTAVQEVVSGERGLFAGLKPGCIIIDMGASGVVETRAWAAFAQGLKACWLDVPVSGGQAGAVNATLSLMVGGDHATFTHVQPILRILGSTITYIGASGAGQITKLANQVIVAMTIAAVAEAFTLARAANADLRLVRESLLGGFAASKILDLHGRRMIENNFEPGGRAHGQLKDSAEAIRLARSCGLRLPMLEANLILWQEMISRGWGDRDHSALIQLYEAGPIELTAEPRGSS